MRLKHFLFSLLFLFNLRTPLQSSAFTWQISAGLWSLEPLTSPAERQSEQMLSEEARHLLTPLLSEFLGFIYQPDIAIRSHGQFVSIAGWLDLGMSRFSVGAGATLIDFTLPFTIQSEQDVFLLGMPIARVTTDGSGQIKLKSMLLATQVKWRAVDLPRMRISIAAGLTLMPFSGNFRLLLNVKINSVLGNAQWQENMDTTIARIRQENQDVPAVILSPALSVAWQYRLTGKIHLLAQLQLSQGTFLAAGLGYGW